MGIPLFMQWLSRAGYKGARFRRLPRNVRTLLFDGNGLLHTVAQTVYAYGKGKNEDRQRYIQGVAPVQLETEYFMAVGQEILRLVREIKPRGAFVFALDGRAPVAKILQQRRRRYLSVLRREEEGSTIFDSNCITPGTDFMRRLDNYLQWFFIQNRQIFPTRLIYSSHLVPGEGENKIFRLLRTELLLPPSGEEGGGVNLIYGLDADLIMYSVISPQSQIVLCRESLTDFIGIDQFKAGVKRDLTFRTSPQTEVVILQDFVVLMYFLGNDFLPHTIAFDGVDQGAQLLIKTYQQLGRPLTDEKGQLEWTNLQGFLQLLGAQEPDLLRQRAAQSIEFPLLERVAVRQPKAPEPQSLSMGLKPREEQYDVVSLDWQAFREGWYNKVFAPLTDEGWSLVNQLGIPAFTLKDVEAMCGHYYRILQWILQYYRGAEVSQTYYYPYLYSPLLGELGHFRGQTTVEEILQPPGEVEPNLYQQLIAVMPPASISLIPQSIAPLITESGPLFDLAPQGFRVDYDGKLARHMGVPILPSLDWPRIVREIDRVTGGTIPKEYHPVTEVDRIRQPTAAQIIRERRQERGENPPRPRRKYIPGQGRPAFGVQSLYSQPPPAQALGVAGPARGIQLPADRLQPPSGLVKVRRRRQPPPPPPPPPVSQVPSVTRNTRIEWTDELLM